jgi:hypothetical protein
MISRLLHPSPTRSTRTPSPKTPGFLSDLEGSSPTDDANHLVFFDFSAWKGLSHWKKRLNNLSVNWAKTDHDTKLSDQLSPPDELADRPGKTE